MTRKMTAAEYEDAARVGTVDDVEVITSPETPVTAVETPSATEPSAVTEASPGG